jgi:hypothetical protein
MVLQADRTTQSALSFNCAISLAVSRPSSTGGCLLRDGQRKRRFGQVLDVWSC